MAPVESDEQATKTETSVVPKPTEPGQRPLSYASSKEIDEWVGDVDEVSAQIRGLIDGTITDLDEFDRQQDLKKRAKEIRAEELRARRERFYLYGIEGKGEGTSYKWWCKRCFVEYSIDLEGNACTRCKQSDKMMTQQQRRDELMGKMSIFKEEKAKHQWRKDKWLRWKKTQSLLKRSRNVNYKAWEYWEPDTDSDEEGEPIVPRNNPEFLAMEADIKARQKKVSEKATTAERCKQRGNNCLKEGDFVGAIEHYEEGLEYRRDCKALWTNKALAELKVFRWLDAVASCNKVIEYSEIFEDGFTKSADACFKAFTRRATALRALHRWEEALEDLEDALKLFPKDRDARELHTKTKDAIKESARAKELDGCSEASNGTSGPVCSASDQTSSADEAARPVSNQPAPSGPVRVEIEESDDEEILTAPEAPASFLAKLSKQDYTKLVRRLEGAEAERVHFCTRQGGNLPKSGDIKRESRKLDLKVEEVAEPSGLDRVVRDAERCCILWRKSQGHTVPLRSDVCLSAKAESDERRDNQEAAFFLRVTVPRVLQLLQLLASNSDHHCELSAVAIRHVWPLISGGAWRHSVFQLLLTWSQHSVCAKALAEFASRYPDPHLNVLISATEDTKENVLPPGFEEFTLEATRRLENGDGAVDAALQDMLSALSRQTAEELAIGTLGNLCVTGQNMPMFKEQLGPQCASLVSRLVRHLRPEDWRLCGRTAATLCNVVRLGGVFAEEVEKTCTGAVVAVLRELGSRESPTPIAQARADGEPGVPKLGESVVLSSVLGALVNILTVRPAAAQRVLDCGALSTTVMLMDPEKACAAVTRCDGKVGDPCKAEAETVVLRAAMVTSRLLSMYPSSLTLELERDLLQRIHRLLQEGLEELSVDVTLISDDLELAVRMLTILLTKTPGCLTRLIAETPRCVELLGEADTLSQDMQSALCFDDLMCSLDKLVRKTRPVEYLGPDDEGSLLSRTRGNLALVYAMLCDEQANDDPPVAIRNLDLAPLIEVFIDIMRKERGKVQNNIAVCVTKLAVNPRYRQKVRDLNGIESLHQIQLPRVEAQREAASKLHRIQGLRGLD